MRLTVRKDSLWASSPDTGNDSHQGRTLRTGQRVITFIVILMKRGDSADDAQHVPTQNA